MYPPSFFLLRYPLDVAAAPSYHIHCPWLDEPSLRRLRRGLDRTLADSRGMEICWLWTDYLKNNAFPSASVPSVPSVSSVPSPSTSPSASSSASRSSGEEGLHPSRHLDDTDQKGQGDGGQAAPTNNTVFVGGARSAAARDALALALFEYNGHISDERFDEDYHTCEICYDDQPGTAFFRAPRDERRCDHTFCTDCLEPFVAMHVKEGSLGALRCPAGKCGQPLPPSTDHV